MKKHDRVVPSRCCELIVCIVWCRSVSFSPKPSGVFFKGLPFSGPHSGRSCHRNFRDFWWSYISMSRITHWVYGFEKSTKSRARVLMFPDSIFEWLRSLSKSALKKQPLFNMKLFCWDFWVAVPLTQKNPLPIVFTYNYDSMGNAEFFNRMCGRIEAMFYTNENSWVTWLKTVDFSKDLQRNRRLAS